MHNERNRDVLEIRIQFTEPHHLDLCRSPRRFELIHEGRVGATVHQELMLRKNENEKKKKKKKKARINEKENEKEMEKKDSSVKWNQEEEEEDES